MLTLIWDYISIGFSIFPYSLSAELQNTLKEIFYPWPYLTVDTTWLNPLLKINFQCVFWLLSARMLWSPRHLRSNQLLNDLFLLPSSWLFRKFYLWSTLAFAMLYLSPLFLPLPTPSILIVPEFRLVLFTSLRPAWDSFHLFVFDQH